MPLQAGLTYVPAIREDVALGVASAAYFVGRRACVFMQNSGLGNVVNGLTSFSLLYKIPVLLIVGWRGHDPAADAPEHSIMGATTAPLLELLGVPYAVPERDNVENTLDDVIARGIEQHLPAALVIRPGVLE
jgi:sulfopyruvate decarboxylase TPP-binding subunit